MHQVDCLFPSVDSWVILSSLEQSIKNKIEAVGTPLREWDINIYRGVLTGYNDAFIIDSAKKEEILLNCKTEEERLRTTELIRPILRGRDIKRYSYDWAGLWLINTHNGVKGRLSPIDINDYPSVKQYLDLHWEKIKKREDKGITPYNLRNCAYMDDFNKPKIVWIELSDEAKFTICEELIPLNTVFFITGEKLYNILGMLNAKITKWYFTHCLGTTSGVGTNRWLKYTIEQLPLIYNMDEQFESIVKSILSKPTIDLEKKIDKILYQAYNLSNEEIDFIESFTQ
ncbi:MAG: class I SAM-dependent DNA methyltransferase [Paludibacteraceae bacterium]|nr:class I SAM-dependent DNA methyltransferase [Paludibacteraceae bacterium]